MTIEGRTYTKEVVRLTDLVDVDGLLDGYTFQGCHIEGPAIIVPTRQATLSGVTFGPSFDAVLWEIPPGRPVVVGAIEARDCVFEECEFRNVGLAGPPELGDRIRQAMRES